MRKRSGYWREGPLWAQKFGIPQSVVNRGKKRFLKKMTSDHRRQKAAMERKAVVAFVRNHRQPFDGKPRLKKKDDSGTDE